MYSKNKGINTLRKSICYLLVIFLMVSITFLFVGCESNTPRITITITFDDGNTETNDTYELSYKLNRKYYPQTVRHYIELIDSGYFNGVIVHDYQVDNNKFVSGAYTDSQFSQREITKLPTASIWADSNKKHLVSNNPLYGETIKNGFEVKNSGFSNEKGALGTYTYVYGQAENNIDQAFYKNVYGYNSYGRKNLRTLNYLHNTVTSMFYISTAEVSLNDEYCVFGVLENQQSKDRFNALLQAISDYTNKQKENQPSYTFTDERSLTIQDKFVNRSYAARSKKTDGSYSRGVYLPKQTITIQSIRVNKY